MAINGETQIRKSAQESSTSLLMLAFVDILASEQNDRQMGRHDALWDDEQRIRGSPRRDPSI
jgi:hypothetical protein